MIESLAVVLMMVGLGVGTAVAGPVLLTEQSEYPAQRYADCGTGVGTQDALQFGQYPLIFIGRPKFDTLQNPLSPPKFPAPFNHGYKDFINSYGQCTDGVRTNLLYRDISHFTGVTNSVICGNAQARNTSQHVLGHGPNCPACNEARLERMLPSVLAELTVREASERWLEDKKIFIQARTYSDYKQYFGTLNAFLGEAIVKELHVGTIVSYQKHRLAAGVGPLRINHEVMILSQMLKAAKRWEALRPFYRRLPVQKVSAGQAMSREEAQRLWDVSKGHKRWEVALYCAILSANSTAGPGEIRNLTLGDIDIQDRVIYIRKGKNKYRSRKLPLNDAALRAVQKLMERAYDKNCHLPTHYLLPHRAQQKGMEFDPTRPQGHWHKAWKKMREAAGMPKLRLYDLRHSCITWMLADPTVPTQVVVEMAGWVDPKMIQVYSHQRIEAKRAAVKALEAVSTEPVQNKKPISTAQFTWQIPATKLL